MWSKGRRVICILTWHSWSQQALQELLNCSCLLTVLILPVRMVSAGDLPSGKTGSARTEKRHQSAGTIVWFVWCHYVNWRRRGWKRPRHLVVSYQTAGCGISHRKTTLPGGANSGPRRIRVSKMRGRGNWAKAAVEGEFFDYPSCLWSIKPRPLRPTNTDTEHLSAPRFASVLPWLAVSPNTFKLTLEVNYLGHFLPINYLKIINFVLIVYISLLELMYQEMTPDEA